MDILGAKKKSKTAPGTSKTFPLPAGMDFSKVAMTLLDGGKMKVTISGGGSEIFSHEDMGFAHYGKTHKNPRKLWSSPLSRATSLLATSMS